jgi:hypothetical protein
LAGLVFFCVFTASPISVRLANSNNEVAQLDQPFGNVADIDNGGFI